MSENQLNIDGFIDANPIPKQPDTARVAREWAGKWCKEVETEGPPLQPDEFELLVSHFQSAVEEAVKDLQDANDNLFKVARKHCVENKQLKQQPRGELARETANVHISHYFPKGYDPNAEPWKSIKAHHKAALKEAVEEYKDLWERASRQADTLAEYLVDAKAELAVAQQPRGEKWTVTHPTEYEYYVMQGNEVVCLLHDKAKAERIAAAHNASIGADAVAPETSTPWASKPPEIRSGEWVECPRCSGTGRVMRYPYYCNIMPELAEKPCEECGGRGRFFVIPDDCFTITISEARRHSTGADERPAPARKD